MPEMRFLIEDILEQKIVDGQNVVRNEDAKEMADRLRKEEGLLCGISSGANVFAAIQLTKIMQ